MSEPPLHARLETVPIANPIEAKERVRGRLLWASIAVLTAVFGKVFLDLGQFAFSSTLYSHILLVPLVAVYFLRQNQQGTTEGATPMRGVGIALLVFGFLDILSYIILARKSLPTEDRLAWEISAYLLLLSGVVASFAQPKTFRGAIFPLGFLIFLIPLPVVVANWIETVLQHTSAAAAAGFFHLARMPMFRNETYFQLPGFSLNVAPECSGIHSTFALFITSVAAGFLCLRTRWHRVLLALVVLPLAVVRNGFRVFVIGELCVRVGPQMIDSYIHHHGGPIFFALSLVPFIAFLFFLIRVENKTEVSRLK